MSSDTPWIKVRGKVVGYLQESDEDANVESEMLVIMDDSGVCFLRCIANDITAITPLEPNEWDWIGAEVEFYTNPDEQKSYTDRKSD